MIKILFEDGDVFETPRHCSKCKCNDTVIPELKELEALPCPLCKKATLELESHIMWD